jgi:hypothetical protein
MRICVNQLKWFILLMKWQWFEASANKTECKMPDKSLKKNLYLLGMWKETNKKTSGE